MSVRDQLLHAAARIYAESGYRGATTRRIATAAGVNEITLFRHFGSKDALIREAIVQAGTSDLPELLPEHPRDPAPRAPRMGPDSYHRIARSPGFDSHLYGRDRGAPRDLFQ